MSEILNTSGEFYFVISGEDSFTTYRSQGCVKSKELRFKSRIISL